MTVAVALLLCIPPLSGRPSLAVGGPRVAQTMFPNHPRVLCLLRGQSRQTGLRGAADKGATSGTGLPCLSL